MADYTALADTQIEATAPITDEVLFALRDNPTAMAEGAAGAPSMLPGIGARTVYGGVGTYVFATGPSVNPGSTAAGSGLRATSALRGTASTNTVATQLWGSGLSGTWRCMGYAQTPALNTADSSVSNLHPTATLWVRII